LRLADREGLRQDKAAERMRVSRQTFGRILAQARRAVAEAVVEGLVLRIEGGEFQVANSISDPGGGDAAPRFLAAASEGDPSKMKKIAVSSEGPDLDSEVDPRFGRAAGFVIIDPDTIEFEYVDNGTSQAMAQGAGIQAAELMTRHGVGVVLTGFVGPKAFQALAAVGIRIGQNLENMTVRQALDKFKQGQVPVAEAPNRTGGRA
jgi:predicted Fe-Mo cluster-binding NifX family protein